MTCQSIFALVVAIATSTQLTQLGRPFGRCGSWREADLRKVRHGIDRFTKVKTLDPSVLRVVFLEVGQEGAILVDGVDGGWHVSDDFIGRVCIIEVIQMCM